MGNIELNYDFRASSNTDRAELKSHIDKLAIAHASLFEDIDTKNLALDREAVNILTYSCGVIKAIIDLKNHSDKPIYAALGEDHTSPAHRLSHMLVVKGLEAEGINLSIGLEDSNKTVKFVFLNKCAKELGRDFDEDIASKYFDKHDLALGNLLYKNTTKAPYSNKILKEFLLQHREKHSCSVKLTDAPLILDDRGYETYYLDLKGKQTSIIFREGTEKRNDYMVNEMTGAGKDVAALQITGIFHIDDASSPMFLNKGTLLDFADKVGFEAIGSITLCKGYTPNAFTYPNVDFKNQGKLRISPSISEERFRWLFPPSVRDIVNDGREIEYLDPKMKLFGMGAVVESGLVNIHNRREDNMLEHIENIRDIVKQSRAQYYGVDIDEQILGLP